MRRTSLLKNPRFGPPLVLFCGCLLASGVAPSCGGEGGARTVPTGVLLVSVDSLRADHVSSYGYRSSTAPDVRTTPRIDDRLAADGLSFDRAVSTTSWTLPAHVSMLTGLPNELHGVRDQSDRLHPSHTLIAEVFQHAGWRTGGFFSGPNVHPWFGFARGFEVYADCSSVAADDPSVLGAGTDDGFADLQGLHDRSHEGVTGPRVADAFEEWFGGVGAEDPFFAFVHLWDVHYDYEAPAEYDVFDPGYQGRVTSGRHRDWAVLRPLRPEDEARILSLYDAEIRFTDAIVGRLLDRLEAAGRLDDTLVVFTSDHGEEFFEHKSFGHRRTLYEEVVRVPLILRWPAGVPRGARSDVLVGIVDVVPTVLDLCDLPSPEGVWGRSLTPAFDAELGPRALPLELTSRRGGVDLRGLHAGGAKILRASAGAETTAHDLRRDPREERPVPGAELPDLDRLARELWNELDERAAELAHLQDGELPPGLTEELVQLGYLGDEGEREEEHENEQP